MVIHDVVVNDHAVGNTVRRVLAAGPLDVVDFCTVGHVNELESIASSNPNHVGSDISCEAGDIVVAAVKHTVVFGEGHQPLIRGDVVAQDAQTIGADVSDVADDFNNSVARLGALPPILVVLEIGFCDEPNTRICTSVDVGAVDANTVGGPVGHAVVDVLTIIDIEV